MLYAKVWALLLLITPTKSLTGFPKEDLKLAFLVAINAESERATVMALKDKGVRSPARLLETFHQHHPQIRRFLSSGVGREMQYEDSILAEKIMLKMMTTV